MNILYFDRKDLINAPLWFHKRELMQTSTGYGRKLRSEYKIDYKERLRRVYYTCCSNCATFFIVINGMEQIINING